MSPRHVRSLLAAVLLFAASIVTAPARAPSGEGRWDRRLEALHPSRPIEYFELAEEVSDAAVDDGERELARHLFALAGVLDEDRLGRSACLALADMEGRAHAARRLQALAALLGERGGEMGGIEGPVEAGDGEPAPAALAALCTAFSHYRRGEGPLAQRALREPGAMELLEANDRLLVGGVKRFLEDCRLYRNGQRRPIEGEDVDHMLRLEAALLAGQRRPFSADLLLLEGQPLAEIDPDRLEQALGVDATRPMWRNGRWLAAQPAALP